MATDYSGLTLGRYLLKNEINRGGMAVVYAASDTRLDCDVAVKIIDRDQIVPTMFNQLGARFEREARAQARLTHPNILKVTDYGQLLDGTPYLVMPLLEGGSLVDRLGEPMPYVDAARLLIPIARALKYVHDKGLIHRDVKPSNILLTETGEPVLADFGIAHIFSEESGAHLTRTGSMIGTPAYMSPEQCRGKVVPASDQYSLGIVLYEMVTGFQPFDGETPVDIFIKQTSEEPAAPRTINPGLPAAVETVILRALKKQPEDRYPDMEQFARELETLVALARLPQPAAPVVSPRPQPGNLAPAGPIPTPPDAERTIIKPPEEYAGKLPVSPDQKLFPATPPTPAPAAPSARASAPERGSLDPERVYQNHGRKINRLAFSPDGETLAFCASNDAVTLLRAADCRVMTTFGSVDDGFTDVVFSPDGAWVGAVAAYKPIRFWDVGSRKLLQKLDADPASLYGTIALSPDGELLAAGLRDYTLGIWEISGGRNIRSITGHTRSVTSAAFSPSQNILATGSNDSTIRFWDVFDGKALDAIKGDGFFVNQLAYSPDGELLACASSRPFVAIWSRRQRKFIQTLPTRALEVSSVAFSPDGRLLACGCNDSRLLVWRMSDGKLLYELTGHTGWVKTVAFSPASSLLASGGDDGAVRLWRLSQ